MSFKSRVDKRRKKYTRFVSDIQYELQAALSEGKRKHGLTQSAVAKKMGVDKSVVHRVIGGGRNLTMHTIADLAWALDHDIEFKLRPAAEIKPNSNWHSNQVEGNVTLDSTNQAQLITPTTPVSFWRK